MLRPKTPPPMISTVEGGEKDDESDILERDDLHRADLGISVGDWVRNSRNDGEEKASSPESSVAWQPGGLL